MACWVYARQLGSRGFPPPDPSRSVDLEGAGYQEGSFYSKMSNKGSSLAFFFVSGFRFQEISFQTSVPSLSLSFMTRTRRFRPSFPCTGGNQGRIHLSEGGGQQILAHKQDEEFNISALITFNSELPGKRGMKERLGIKPFERLGAYYISKGYLIAHQINLAILQPWQGLLCQWSQDKEGTLHEMIPFCYCSCLYFTEL